MQEHRTPSRQPLATLAAGAASAASSRPPAWRCSFVDFADATRWRRDQRVADDHRYLAALVSEANAL